jgi:Protein of unknown function (DUF3300)
LIVTILKQSLSLFLSGCLLLTSAQGAFAAQAGQSETQSQTQSQTQSETQPPVQEAPQTPAQLQQLVAPIALYADALVAQVLAAATYPDQIVEADRWLQQHPDLKGEQLGHEVDKQPWDPSVKALTEFPSVLANMDKNLSWTSSLGDAYVNQQQDVMDAVQVMRQRAKQAGNLNSTSQQTVSQQGQTIVIEPADPQVVYVPAYDPWLVYGAPLGVWRGGSALASATLVASDGAGTTGDMTGITTASFSITTPTSPTAESSPITMPSITRGETSITATDFRAAALAEVRGSTDRRESTDS